MKFILKGDIVYSKSYKELSTNKNSYLLCEDGKCKKIFSDINDIPKDIKIYDYTGHIIIPGLVDLHLHAPQYAFVGLHMDLELLDWLNKYTFVEESKYKKLEYAKKAYDIFVNELKKSPTTRFAIFATLHREATEYLFEKLEETNMKGYVGKVNQDINNIDILNETTKDSIDETYKWITNVKKYKNILPIITPRFISSCSNELLNELSKISIENHIPVQSHLLENTKEDAWVKELHKDVKTYTDCYKKFNLLGEENTIMAHCIWTSEYDKELLKNDKVWVAHCPSSNRNLTSGIAPIKEYVERGINVAIATDVAGGSYISMFRAIEDTITASKIRSIYVDKNYSNVTLEEAFYMATVGGGSFFGKVGKFEEGYDLDCIVLDESNNPTVLMDELSLTERLERYIYRPNEKIVAKFVNGVKIDI